MFVKIKTMGAYNQREDVLYTICNIWSWLYATHGFDSDIQYNSYAKTQAPTSPISSEIYIKVPSRDVGKELLATMGYNGCLTSKRPKKTHSVIVPVVKNLMDITNKSIARIEWLGERLIDEMWVKQCLYNCNFDYAKLAGYIMNVILYEAVEAGYEKEDIVTANIFSERTNTYTFCFIALDRTKEYIAGTTEVLPTQNVWATINLDEIENVEEGFEIELLMMNLRTYAEDKWARPEMKCAISTEYTNKDYKRKGYPLPKEPIDVYFATQTQKYENKEHFLDDNIMPIPCKTARFDQPIVGVMGHMRTLKSGKQIWVKGYTKHKRMKADWYE